MPRRPCRLSMGPCSERMKGDVLVALVTFYEQVDGDLDDVRKRLITDERIEKFVRVFAADETYATLEKAFAEDQVESAFRAAHTMKGISRDLGFSSLSERASELTEALRADDDGIYGSMEQAAGLYDRVRDAYAAIIEAVPLLDE